nr:uncharacterized protein LOC107280363 isoform X2 [Oryza sativa Japonica Group]
MGMLSLKRLMARQRQREWRRRRQKAQKPRDGSIASERKGNNYQCGKRLRYSWPNFPELPIPRSIRKLFSTRKNHHRTKALKTKKEDMIQPQRSIFRSTPTMKTFRVSGLVPKPCLWNKLIT